MLRQLVLNREFISKETNQISLSIIDQFIKDNGQTIELLKSKSFVLVSLSRFEESLECCNDMLRLDNNDAEALVERATIHFELGNKDKAVQDLNQFLQNPSGELNIL